MQVDLPRCTGGTRRVSLPQGVNPAGLVVMPGLVDLTCDPGFPGFPVRETPASLAAAALAGGFTDLLLEPAVDPVRDTPEQVERTPSLGGGVRGWPVAAMTMGLAGQALSEIGLLVRAGCVAISDGGRPVRDTVVLRNILEYAGAFDVLVIARPADPDLDVLGVVDEGPFAARVGLRGNPSSNEHIGVYRLLSLCESSGARLHLTHIGTAESVALIVAAQARGLPVTASTPARNLILDNRLVLERPYDSRLRLHPPLRQPRDREALIAAVRAGALVLTADHRPRAPEEKELEFERAVPGSTGLESALGAALLALQDPSLVAEALSLGPRRVAGLAAGPEILVDTTSVRRVSAAAHRSCSRSDALEGWELPGQVLAVLPSEEGG